MEGDGMKMKATDPDTGQDMAEDSMTFEHFEQLIINVNASTYNS